MSDGKSDGRQDGKNETDRRRFLQSVAFGSAAAFPPQIQPATPPVNTAPEHRDPYSGITYPRAFAGPSLSMISFPLGGIGAGSIGLGGRGQLRDWEIFNRPDIGNSPSYAFASIWVKPEGEPAVAHVLEARLQPPYEGQDGLGSRNAPGLSRLEGATFTGEFPRAHVQFHDRRLPLDVRLDAGSPFIPGDGDASGLPLALLRYQVRNTSKTPVAVSIAYSLENPVKFPRSGSGAKRAGDKRQNRFRNAGPLSGLLMSNAALNEQSEDYGTFVLGALHAGPDQLSYLEGWPAGGWWNSALLFWDDFSEDGALGKASADPSAIGALAVKKTIAPGQEVAYPFLMAWHFPNRTPERCGWDAPKGRENTIIGNWYATRFSDAWAVAEFGAANLDSLMERTDRFADIIRRTTVPDPAKEAAMSNLSTLVSTTCFRTADGEFHGFEGVDDHSGCCFGNCTHVWNYETATAHLFPQFSRSLRRSAFGYSMDERGAMFFRQFLPDGFERFGFAAADGQMGQIMKVYMDWQISGDAAFLAEFWPKAKRALEFAWVKGGWDADRDGILEGVQHNTYDVEFYGPNPLCTIYYLGALRAGEEMAQAAKDTASASEYRRLYESGRQWLDSNLFNGEYYIQKVESRTASSIAPGLRGTSGADDPEHPQYQVGSGCLIDQLLGQYLADVCGLGTLIDPTHLEETLDSIHRYNHKANLFDHDTVQRTFALNDEAAMVICDYAKGERPRIPFPYYAEVMTGFEHAAAALMIYRGHQAEGIRAIENIRRRYDGKRRNPWDEAECGHHYARAMASWSSLLALSGFHYRGPEQHAVFAPRYRQSKFRSFWSAGNGWGEFELHGSPDETRLTPSVTEGELALWNIELAVERHGTTSVQFDNRSLAHTAAFAGGRVKVRLNEMLMLRPNHRLQIDVS